MHNTLKRYDTKQYIKNAKVGEICLDSYDDNYYVYDGNDWMLVDPNENKNYEVILDMDYPYIKILNNYWLDKHFDELVTWLARGNGEYLAWTKLIRLNSKAIATFFILKFGGDYEG